MASSDTTVSFVLGQTVLAGEALDAARKTASSNRRELVIAAKAGCRDSFTELVRLHTDSILRFFYARLRNLADAEDLAQETFLLAWRNIDQCRQDSSFSAWLFTIALNQLRTRMRRKKILLPLTNILRCTKPGPDQSVEGKEENQQLWDVAEKHLSSDQYTAMLLRYRAELSTMEIAEAMNKTHSHVKVLLHRARIKLHSRIERTEFSEAAAE
ncbi:MAG TPA: sigma-70 family RNA polymerase sigma factor [Anaerohalosphaeraceae bacterium]|jgi:RNA polymerase sigma-70 factor (ECF subfamily)|nr:sigma-70 family RNA polymerase sigma factor [Anaerohalosphaeraceae bacterium]